MADRYIGIGLELFIGFFALMFLTKVIGRSQIKEATPFDFVSSIVLGEMVGNAIYDPKIGLFQVLFAVFLWGILIFIMKLIDLKVNKVRGILENEPAIIIRDGVINREQMKKAKLDMNQLQALLRREKVFSLREVLHAILEPNGSISVIKNPIYDTPTKKELNIPVFAISLPVTLISDGSVIKRNLTMIDKSEQWLNQELKQRNINRVKDVFIAEWRLEDGLFIQKQ